MPTIKEIHIYPVKSCRGVSVDTAELVPTGLALDRHWMVVDHENHFVTQREQPRLALVETHLVPDGIVLKAPGLPALEIGLRETGESAKVELFGETCAALRMRDAADQWFSRYLGGDFGLVAFDPSFHRQGGVQYPSRDQAPAAFTDNYGILVISNASREDLNHRLGTALPMNRFRPNIVVEGIAAYEEDYFVSAQTGSASLRFVNPCTRCQMTGIDQATGQAALDPLPTLGAYRYDGDLKGVKFGNYAVVQTGIGKRLRVGDTLDVEWNF